MRLNIGWLLIAICFLYVIVNTIVIISYALSSLWLLLKRIFMLRRRKKLRSEVVETNKKINFDLPLIAEMNHKGKSKDYEVEANRKFSAHDAIGGGYGSECIGQNSIAKV